MDTTRIIQSKKFLNLTDEIANPYACYLFHGTDELLVNAFAHAFAASVLCEKHTFCGNCDSCIRINLKKHPDLLVYEKPMLSVADAKEIIEKSLPTPIFAKYKIFLILNADSLNELAQNKLLKSLEEPNSSTVYILTTCKVSRLLPTIVSRCRKIELTGNDSREMFAETATSDIFTKNLTISDIKNIESKNFSATFDKVLNVLNTFEHSSDIPKTTNTLNTKDFDKNMFFQIIMSLFKDKVYLNLGLDNLCTFKKHLTQQYSNQELLKIGDVIQNSYQKMQHNVYIGYVLDEMLTEILKARTMWK